MNMKIFYLDGYEDQIEIVCDYIEYPTSVYDGQYLMAFKGEKDKDQQFVALIPLHRLVACINLLK